MKTVYIPITNCSDCPHGCFGSDRAEDFHCGHDSMGSKGRILPPEDSGNKIIPDWCPFNKEKSAEVRHPIDSEGNLNKKVTYCFHCGTNVKNQKYCHGCGSKLLWNSLIEGNKNETNNHLQSSITFSDTMGIEKA